MDGMLCHFQLGRVTVVLLNLTLKLLHFLSSVLGVQSTFRQGAVKSQEAYPVTSQQEVCV